MDDFVIIGQRCGKSACRRLEGAAAAAGLRWTLTYGPGHADEPSAFRLVAEGGRACSPRVLGSTEEQVRAAISSARSAA